MTEGVLLLSYIWYDYGITTVLKFSVRNVLRGLTCVRSNLCRSDIPERWKL